MQSQAKVKLSLLRPVALLLLLPLAGCSESFTSAHAQGSARAGNGPSLRHWASVSDPANPFASLPRTSPSATPTPAGAGCAARDTISLGVSHVVLRANANRTFSASMTGCDGPTARFEVRPSTSAGLPAAGVVGADGTYSAPANIPASLTEAQRTVTVRASLANHPDVFADVSVTLLPAGAFGVPDDGHTDGPKGNVYDFHGTQYSALPDFATLTPFMTLVTPNFDLPTQSYTLGFPGVPNLTTWFGIRFRATLKAPADGTYTFTLVSDDGARLYLDEGLVVDNDGVHATTRSSGTTTLKAGAHALRLDYFEGPPVEIALQLLWRRPGGFGDEVVPAEVLSSPR